MNVEEQPRPDGKADIDDGKCCCIECGEVIPDTDPDAQREQVCRQCMETMGVDV